VSDHCRYAADEADAPLRGPLVPTRRRYRLAAPEVGMLFDSGRPEPDERRTSFRMTTSDEALLVTVTCRGSAQDDSVEVYLTQCDQPSFPVVIVTVAADGGWTAGVIPRPYTPYFPPPVEPFDPGEVTCEVETEANGWRALVTLTRHGLGLPRNGFYANVVRRADGTAHAWCDLWDGVAGQVEVFGRVVRGDGSAPESNAIVLPAGLAVGVNHLRIAAPDPAVSLRVAGQEIRPTEDGAVAITVADRGPVDIDLLRGGAVIAAYHADVPRPLLVACHEAFLRADVVEVTADITLNVAGDAAFPVVVTCRREGGGTETRDLTLEPGRHPVTLTVPNGRGSELTVEARANVPGLGGPLVARHWCAVGLSREDLDVYREGLRDLGARDLCWAAVADAIHLRRLGQAGCGAYGNAGPRQNAPWGEAFVYAIALLYKTEHPTNPHRGDKRLLESAVLAMEHALRPTVSQAERVDPDNRSLQAFLLTYELLKDDIEPARRDYWAYELQHRTQGVADRWVRAVSSALGMTSADCGTGSNHMAYHIANVYLAGDLFGREDWKTTAAAWLRRFAAHGEAGHWEERTGVTVATSYTWLSANGVGEYFSRSGDRDVEPALDAFARFGAAVTTDSGRGLALHDGRNSGHGGGPTGAFVLSRSARGRAAARARLVAALGQRPSDVSLETLWRYAENALNFIDGPEADFTADGEHAFNRGVVARRTGFQYGLSTINLGPVNGLYRLDPQNVVEVFHRGAGCILHGGNSSLQPEAGSFFRAPGDGPTVRGLAAPTAPRVDYLPNTAAIKRLADGHDLDLVYWTFTARVAVHVLSARRARLVVTVRELHDGPGPVVFSFFPGVSEAEEMTVDAQSVAFRTVRFETNRDVRTERGFRIMNPYTFEFSYEHKPVRCWTEMAPDRPFVLDIRVDL